MRTDTSDKQNSPRLHLCLVSHRCRRNDGQSRVNYEIVKAALRRGWLVTFIGSSLSDDLRNLASLKWLEVKRSRLPSNLIKDLIFALKGSILLKRHRAKFDVVHTNGFIVWPESDINTFHFVHSAWLRSRFYPYKPVRSLYSLYQYSFTLLNSYLEQHAFKVSARLIAVSETVKREIKASGIPEEKISVIHNGVDLEEFHPGRAQRMDFSLPEDSMLFLFAGDIRTKRKNLESVLQALRLVPDIHLAVAGELKGSPYPDQAKKLGLAGRVHFLGLVADMPGLMRSVDAFVFPSRYEPFGLVLLEALASGLPVITAVTAGGAEVIGDGGIVISNPDDIQQLANAMTRLARDTQLRASMASKARQVATKLSWSAMADRYLELQDRRP